jgi:hypothetical protein
MSEVGTQRADAAKSSGSAAVSAAEKVIGIDINKDGKIG